MSANGQLRAKASPSKAFFIEMLTRDITLSDCVLDLVDNAIHRLIVETGLDVSEHLFTGTNAKKVSALIEVSFTPSSFRITAGESLTHRRRVTTNPLAALPP